MAEMSSLRKEDLSLYYYIKDVALSNFLEVEEYISLDLLEEISTETTFIYEALTEMVPKPTGRGRGWKYFDTVSGYGGNACVGYYPLVSGTRADGVTIIGTPEQSLMVTVYEYTLVSGIYTYVPISDTEYVIDYVDGRILTSGTVNPTHVSYTWNYVSVVDEWATIEAAGPPVVVIDMFGTDKKGFQLGGGKKTTRKVDIHIFASNTAERNDLTEALYDALYLKGCPLYDFPLGSALDYDGTFYGRFSNMNKLETLFDTQTLLYNRSHLTFEDVSSRNVILPTLLLTNQDENMISTLNSYRAKITFNLVSHTEGF